MATALSVTQVGEKLDLTIRQGSTLGPIRHTLKDAAGAPIDLTGYTVRASVRKTPKATEVAAVFVITMAPTLADGWYEFSIPDEVTGGLTVGELLSSPESAYAWDSELETPDGRVIPLFFGVFRVQPEVTREDV